MKRSPKLYDLEHEGSRAASIWFHRVPRFRVERTADSLLRLTVPVAAQSSRDSGLTIFVSVSKDYCLGGPGECYSCVATFLSGHLNATRVNELPYLASECSDGVWLLDDGVVSVGDGFEKV